MLSRLLSFFVALPGIWFVVWGVYAGGILSLLLGASLAGSASASFLKPVLARVLLLVCCASTAVPSILVGVQQANWDVVIPRCLSVTLDGVGLPPPGQIADNLAVVGFWNNAHANALYLSSKYHVPVLREDYELQFAVFGTQGLTSFLRAVSCETMVKYAEADVLVHAL